MKSKFFTLFAAFVLLFSAQASAQTNGDVNSDGKVNEQDIAAILEIMQQAGGVKEKTKYYWYVGTDNPASMTPPSVGDANATLCEWTLLSSKPTEIAVYKTDENWDEHTWYIAIPEEYGYSIYDNGNNNITNITFTKTTSTIANVKYAIYTTTFKMDTIDVKVKQ